MQFKGDAGDSSRGLQVSIFRWIMVALFLALQPSKSDAFIGNITPNFGSTSDLVQETINSIKSSMAKLFSESSLPGLVAEAREPSWECLGSITVPTEWIDMNESGDISAGDCYRISDVYVNAINFRQDQTVVSLLPNRTDQIGIFFIDEACRGLRVARIYKNQRSRAKRPSRSSLVPPESAIAQCKSSNACTGTGIGLIPGASCEPVFRERQGVRPPPFVQRATRECDSFDLERHNTADPWDQPYITSDSATGEKICYGSCRTRSFSPFLRVAGPRCVSSCDTDSEYDGLQNFWCWRTGWVAANHYFSTANNLGSSLLHSNGDVIFTNAMQTFTNSQEPTAIPTLFSSTANVLLKLELSI